MNILEYIFSRIPDNTSKKVTPKDIRESFAKVDEKIDEISKDLKADYGGTLTPADNPGVLALPTWFWASEGTYPLAGNLTIGLDKLGILSWNGTEWRTIELGLPAGKSAYQIAVELGYPGTEPEWIAGLQGKTTEQWSGKPFVAGSTVYFGGNSIWEAAEDTLDTDVPGVSPKWVLRLTANETTDGTKLLNITDAYGNILGYFDKEGRLATLFREGSIETSALQKEVSFFFEGSEITETPDFQKVIADPFGHILSGIKKDGTHYFNNLEAETYRGNIQNQQSNSEPITSATYLNFDFPDSIVDVDVYGDMPTDASDARTATNVVVTFSKGGQFLFKCKGIMAIQGQGSASYPKKGYEIDFFNIKDEKLIIKWGNMHPVDAINFKAFYSDPTMTRDVSAGRLWYKIRTSRPFPSSFIADFNYNNSSNNSKYLYYDDALFYAEGFPMRMTSNGNPFGLFVWRMKKKRENYRMDSANLNNIFLDSAVNTGINLAAPFNPANWDLKSPKLSGYEEAGNIPNAIVLASINRFFNWTTACEAGTVNMRNTYQDYLNLDSFIDYLITCEALLSVDSAINNLELMTWDGLRWSICIYDQDNSAGFFSSAFLSPTEPNNFNTPFWNRIKSVFSVEIKARYTELRNNGVLSMNTIYDIYAEIPRKIPTDYYIENLSLWGWAGQESGNTSLRHILGFFKARLEYLDTIYKN